MLLCDVCSTLLALCLFIRIYVFPFFVGIAWPRYLSYKDLLSVVYCINSFQHLFDFVYSVLSFYIFLSCTKHIQHSIHTGNYWYNICAVSMLRCETPQAVTDLCKSFCELQLCNPVELDHEDRQTFWLNVPGFDFTIVTPQRVMKCHCSAECLCPLSFKKIQENFYHCYSGMHVQFVCMQLTVHDIGEITMMLNGNALQWKAI